MTDDTLSSLNDETRAAWDANAQVWDAKMAGDGNLFVQLLLQPAFQRLLDVRPGQKILDAACGNGIFSRKLAEWGAAVTAFDFSAELIKLAQARPSPGAPITYHVLDATDEDGLLAALTPAAPFDAALCSMALFDIADIQPLFRALAKLLKPGGVFVFAITHPAFNNAASVHMAEEADVEGAIRTVYSVKISRYMTPYHARGLALRNQPKPQVYFDRPLQYYLQSGFAAGFVLDGFEERAFPSETPQTYPLGWGGSFSEIPPALVGRFRLDRPDRF